MRAQARRALLGTALGTALVVVGCTMEEPGHTLQLQVQPLVDGRVQGPIAAPDGSTLFVERLLLDVGPLELLPCPSTQYAGSGSTRPQQGGALARLGQALRGFRWLPVARAHDGGDSPTRFGGTLLVNALDGRAQSAAFLEPPLGSYCSLLVGLSPTDSHALGEQATPEVLGTSMHASGQAEHSGQRTPFEAMLYKRLVAELEFSTPLQLRGEPRAHHVSLELDSAAALDALIRYQFDPAPLDDDVLHRLFRLRVQ